MKKNFVLELHDTFPIVGAHKLRNVNNPDRPTVFNANMWYKIIRNLSTQVIDHDCIKSPSWTVVGVGFNKSRCSEPPAPGMCLFHRSSIGCEEEWYFVSTLLHFVHSNGYCESDHHLYLKVFNRVLITKQYGMNHHWVSSYSSAFL